MPRDSNGNTSPIPGIIVSSGDLVLPSQHNPFVNDVYAMITQSLSRDGQGGMRANLNMNGFKVSNIGAGTLPNDAVSVSQFQSGMPVGAIVDYAGDAAPSGWMLCYGQAISRTAYPDAFAACGAKFGSGDGSTTFNLPDFRGRIGVGKDDMGGADAARMSFFGALAKTIGSVFGSSSHILTIAEIPSHSHSGQTQDAGGHDHEYPGPAFSSSSGGNRPSGSGGDGFLKTLLSGIHRHLFTTNSSGGGLAHTNTQPSIVINKIIKVSY